MSEDISDDISEIVQTYRETAAFRRSREPDQIEIARLRAESERLRGENESMARTIADVNLRLRDMANLCREIVSGLTSYGDRLDEYGCESWIDPTLCGRLAVAIEAFGVRPVAERSEEQDR